MLTPNNAKDLMALACVAFKNKDFSGAGSLFAQAMSLHDSETFVDSLLIGNFTCAALASSIEDSIDTDDDDLLASIASTLSFNMSTSFRRDLKESLNENEYSLSESGCSAHNSQNSEDEELDDEDFEDDEDEGEDFDLSDEDEDDFESDSSAPLFSPVKSLLRLK